MRLIFSFIILLMTSLWMAGQPGVRSALRFESTDWDFGSVPEHGGKVSHTFRFTNDGTGPVIVNQVVSSCRCATPAFTRKTVKPGERGEITITFDPEGITDTFAKSVRVISSSGQYILWIRGKIAIDMNIERDYPYQMAGGLVADRRTLSFGQIQHGCAPVQQTIRLFNTSDKEVKLSCRVTGSSGCIFISMPECVAAGSEAAITVTTSPQSGYYGTLTDRIIISADGIICPEIRLFGTIIDDLRRTRPETAARMSCSETYFDLSGMSEDSTCTKIISISNEGTDNLIIRKIECQEGISFSRETGQLTLKRGEKIQIKFEVDLNAMGDAPDAKVRFITNDSKQPVHTIIFERERAE